ncbi:hypothetical protein [Corynebacterium aquatimens]|uniref:Ferredoxin--NADP+ reductase n=1 Tax=Corynebacterium aquatimens TaxID=1190508 RepID=A0A931E458_9CORY|nr:hypothetical protein [Corynebacterium aquatimens]MBG6122148.1 ferredoxin--NADP+ reductase [Corynebacterium aquatimens]WJY65311.1 NADPH-ferredoxin reductase FprA [Corynebacterium aquatimens]
MIHDSRVRRVAVVGAGPAGIHALDTLICMAGHDYYVDLFDALPAPLGVIGFGSTYRVAADTPGAVPSAPRLRLFGNVTVGTDITVGELTTYYDTVIVAGQEAGEVPVQAPVQASGQGRGGRKPIVIVGTNETSNEVLALLREDADLIVSRTPVVVKQANSHTPGAIIRLLKNRSVPFTSWTGWHRPAQGVGGPQSIRHRHQPVDVVTVAQWSQRLNAIRNDTVVP